MGIPITGAFARATQGSAPYAGAAKWGNGINAIHQYYSGPPRGLGRQGVPNDLDQRTVPSMASDDQMELGPPWGAPDDPSYADVYSAYEVFIGDPEEPDTWPNLGNSTMVMPSDYPAWNQDGTAIRSKMSTTNGPRQTTQVSELPTETVNEGWLNKPVTGHLEPNTPENVAGDSDPSQIFVQTSEVQRNKGMTQPRLQMDGPEGTRDVPRHSIKPRKAGPKLKVYSGLERHYDMFPRQIDDIPRPFYFRTAGTGPNPYLWSNQTFLNTPMQRTPPPDPSMGFVDTSFTDPDDPGSYGYSSEDWGY
jgi:hypothetical protein